MPNNLRAVIVGASTLLGKELIEELSKSSSQWDLRLTEATDSAGQLVAGDEEAFVVQPLTPDVFEGQDVAFFAESVSSTRAHWREAQLAGAAVIDLTRALDSESGAVVLCPWIESGEVADREERITIPAHPAAVMLGIVGSRLKKSHAGVRLAATVLEPASQQGSRGMDELHQQTVSLLGFHSLPQEVYDAQIAFNLRVSLGKASQPRLGRIAEMIRSDVKAIAGECVASRVAVQVVQAPVFHGYMMSVFVELPDHVDESALREALSGGVVKVMAPGGEEPSNQSVAQEGEIEVVIRGDSGGYWLWMAADNLKLAARQAVTSANEISARHLAGRSGQTSQVR